MENKTKVEIVIAVIVFLVIALVVLFVFKPSPANLPTLNPNLPAVNPGATSTAVAAPQININPNTGQITVTQQQPTYPTPTNQTPDTAKFVFNNVTITLANHTFSPKFFKVAAGTKLTINFKPLDSTHTFVFDDPSLSSVALGANAGETKSITFTVPATPGTYTFYCNVGGNAHRNLGESGAMIVE